jgi:hypothetical protein
LWFGVTVPDVGPEPDEPARAPRGTAGVSAEGAVLGTAKGPTEDAVLMLRAGLAGRALEKALVIDCWRGRDGPIGVIGVIFGVGLADI